MAFDDFTFIFPRTHLSVTCSDASNLVAQTLSLSFRLVVHEGELFLSALQSVTMRLYDPEDRISTLPKLSVRLPVNPQTVPRNML